VADSETIEVEYESALALMRDLGAMGESNLVVERRRGLARRATLLRAAAIYSERFTLPSGRVAASFEVLSCTAGRRMTHNQNRSSRAAPPGGWPMRWAPPSTAPAKRWSGARSCLS